MADRESVVGAHDLDFSVRRGVRDGMRRRLLPTLLAAIAITMVAVPASASAASFAVTGSDDVDDGTCDARHCSLREAILAANATAAVDHTIGLGADGTPVIASGRGARFGVRLLARAGGARIGGAADGAGNVIADHVIGVTRSSPIPGWGSTSATAASARTAASAPTSCHRFPS